MGIKIKILIIVLTLSNVLFGQNKKEIHIIKKYAMYKCLMNNYSQADLTFKSHDYTASYVFQIEKVDYNLLDKIDKYVLDNTSSFYKDGISENLEDEKANYICWKCIDFFESKKLEKYIKKITNYK